MSIQHVRRAGRTGTEAAGKAKRGVVSAEPTGAHPILHMQRAIGNKAVETMVAGRYPVQAKLVVGPAGDSYEQEADRVGQLVADRVSSGAEPAASSASPVQRSELEGGELEEEELQMKRESESIQRSDMEGGELEEEELQMKRDSASIQRSELEGGELEEEELQMKRESGSIQRSGMEGGELEEEELQMKRAPEGVQRSSDDGFEAGDGLERQIESSRGKGTNMDSQLQAKMEDAFGTGFGDVSIHTDAGADEMAGSIGAKAFTTGSDIFFRQGQYNPGSREGRELLGHELTHVVQQRGGGAPS